MRRNAISCLVLVVASLLWIGILPAVAQPTGVELAQYSLGEMSVTDLTSNVHVYTVSLEGVITLPQNEGGAPLVVIFHGRHGICGGASMESYPCPADQPEVRFDEGFEYLMNTLSQRGYASLAINLNGAMTTAFGAANINARAAQIFSAHFAALQKAISGGENDFGVTLEDRIDLSQIGFIGHSSGGSAALEVVRQLEYSPTPASAILLLAAAYNTLGTEGQFRTGDELNAAYATPSDVAVATVLPACDGDQTQFYSQFAYETARYDRQRSAFAASVWLFGANHAYFNRAVERDEATRYDIDRCSPNAPERLSREQQEAFLQNYAPDFFDAAFGANQPADAFNPYMEAPFELYGEPVQINVMAPSDQRLTLMFPRDPAEVTINALGGSTNASGAALVYCEQGQVCLTETVAAGRFGHLRFTYSGMNSLRFDVPSISQDLSEYVALHLRTVPEFTSSLNIPGTSVPFNITITDRAGNSAQVMLPPELPAFQNPTPVDFYGYIAVPTYPGDVRVPLSEFERVDLTQIASVSLDTISSTDQRGGSFLIADLEFVRPG